MKFFLVSIFALSSFYANAFHAVTEVLPSGKVLICKDFNQEVKGNIIETYRLKNPGSKTDKALIKIKEQKLPSVGEKILFSRQELIQKNKLLKEINDIPVGEGEVLDSNLLGELKTVINYRNRAAFLQKKRISINEKEAKKIASECIVVALSNDSKVLEGDLVKF